MKMKDLSVTNKMLILSLIYAFSMAAIIIAGLTYIASTKESADKVYTEAVVEQKALLQLKIDLEDTRRTLVTMIAELQEEHLHQLIQALKRSEESLDNNLSHMLSPSSLFDIESRPMLNRFKSVWNEFRDTRNKDLLPAIYEGRTRDAVMISHNIQEERFQILLGLVSDLIEHEDSEVMALRKAMENDYRMVVIYYVLFASLGFALILSLHIYISRHIGERLQEITDTAEKIEYNNIVNVSIGGRDEIGRLAESFNRMSGRLHEEMTLREQYMATFKKNAEEIEDKNRLLEESLKKIAEKNKEVDEARLQVIQSEKMASVGLLAAGVAHEINNPIGFIKSNLNTLSEYANDITALYDLLNEIDRTSIDGNPGSITEPLIELQSFIKEKELDFILNDMVQLITESKEGLERVSSIVRGLKEFSHKGGTELTGYDLNQCLDNAVKVAWNEIKYRAEVDKEYGELPLIACYPQQLHQVFLNIIVNAAQAIKDKGKIVLKTSVDSENAIVSIKDNGSGMDKETLKKIFEPFFTTKPVGQGTGLGLYVAYQIIKNHNGSIDVESTSGEGTTFTVRFPINTLSSFEKPCHVHLQV